MTGGTWLLRGPASPAMMSRTEPETASLNKHSGSEIMRNAIVIEKAESNFSAYAPDLAGCIATGASVEEVEKEIQEAIAFHLEGMREDGITPPAPLSQVDYVEVAA